MKPETGVANCQPGELRIGAFCRDGTWSSMKGNLEAADTFTCARRGGELSCWGLGLAELHAVDWWPTRRGDDGVFAAAGAAWERGTVCPGPACSGWVQRLEGAVALSARVETDRTSTLLARTAEGQLVGFNLSTVEEPIEFAARDAIDHAGGIGRGCLVSSDGSVACWGPNFGGQVGTKELTGAAPNRDGTACTEATKCVYPQPIRVVGIERAKWVALGGNAISGLGGQTCVVTEDEQLWCWGRTTASYYAHPETQDEPVWPHRISGVPHPVAVAVGPQHACALSIDHTVRCWGANQFGESGPDPRSFTDNPVEVPVPADTIAISAGGYDANGSWPGHTCVLTLAGTVSCFGDNQLGQLGRGAPPAVSKVLASDVIELRGGEVRPTIDDELECARLADGTGACFGFNRTGAAGLGSRKAVPRATTVLGGAQLRSLDTNGSTTCAVTATGVVYCWGTSLGDVSSTPLPTPIAVPSPQRAVEVRVGTNHACLVSERGELGCWGFNNRGQLADGTVVKSFTPVFTQTGIAHVAAGAGTCALRVDGEVRCFGFTDPGVRAVASLEMRGGLACAIHHDGRVSCWGESVGHNRLGNGNWDVDPAAPVVNVLPVTDIVRLQLGLESACALTREGTAFCWGGWRFSNFMGTRTTATGRTIMMVEPTTAQHDEPASALVLTRHGRCFVDLARRLRCTGDESGGPLGDDFVFTDVASEVIRPP